MTTAAPRTVWGDLKAGAIRSAAAFVFGMYFLTMGGIAGGVLVAARHLAIWALANGGIDNAILAVCLFVGAAIGAVYGGLIVELETE